MSLVGPAAADRAPRTARSTAGRRGRLDLTPGLTGLWQVLGRTSIPFEEMVKLDYLYVTNWSLWSDVKLLLRTLPVLLSKRVRIDIEPKLTTPEQDLGGTRGRRCGGAPGGRRCSR